METNETFNVMMKDFLDHSLLAHNTFGIEARCHRFIEFSNIEEAQAAAGIVREAGLPLLIGGRGQQSFAHTRLPWHRAPFSHNGT